MKTLDNIFVGIMCKFNMLKNRVMYDENGDTNLISIIMVLGIVLALVVIFRKQIGSIVATVQSSVDEFSTSIDSGP